MAVTRLAIADAPAETPTAQVRSAGTVTPAAVADVAAAVRTLDVASLRWLSGYAAGLAEAREHDELLAPAPALTSPPSPTLAIETVSTPRIAVIHGSQTGNARRQAERLAQQLRGDGHAVELRGTGGLRPAELARWSVALIVISTQGDGDPPEEALDFIEALAGRRAPPLASLHYAVLALGDSSYPHFCATGRQVDERLAQLGARRIAPLAEADVDIEPVATPWIEHTRAAVSERFAAPAVGTVPTPLHRSSEPTTGLAHNTTPGPAHPFPAEVIVSQPITDARAARVVHHLELDVSGSGMHWQPGDALAVSPRNPVAAVDAVLEALALPGEVIVAHDGIERPLHAWLSAHREITRLHRDAIVHQATQQPGSSVAGLLADPAALRHWIERHQFLDLARTGRGIWDAASLVARLKPIAPRLYSIASSQAAHPGELHLTVAALEGAAGAASSMLIGADEGERVPVHLASNPAFRLPADGDRPMVMVAAGTGIAPFRAFLQQRVADGARGANWLLFGNRRFREDFLYQSEWQAALADGRLQRLSLAFSRDGDERVHVTQRLREAAADLRAAIAEGAHLYVCGGLAMGRDVHGALLDVLSADHAGDRDAAEAQLRALRQDGRYARDLY